VRLALLLTALLVVMSGCRDGSRSVAPPDGGGVTAASGAVRTPTAKPATQPGCKQAAFNSNDPAFIADSEDFERKGAPRKGEWLDRFPETGTTFEEYIQMRVVRRTAERNRIVLQPLGAFRPEEREVLQKLREFTQLFFDTTTTLADPIALPEHGYRVRKDLGGRVQYHTHVLLHEILKPRLPADAVCYLGVTMTDLFPDPKWNYVFGEATLEERIGVYSLVRYFPSFWGERDTPEARRRGLLRSFKVLAHETGHMFSLHHCTRFECLMNGSNSLEEMDRQPAHLCPVCLQKLQWNLGFDVRVRYQRLREIGRREGLDPLADWIEHRLERIGAGPEPDCDASAD
jgi:archaemetzincin